MDHVFALTLIGAFAGSIAIGTLRGSIQGALISGWMLAPMSWWLKLNAKLNATAKPANIFYENDCSADDVERYRH